MGCFSCWKVVKWEPWKGGDPVDDYELLEMLVDAVAVLIGDYAPIRKIAALKLLHILLPDDEVKGILADVKAMRRFEQI